MATRHDGLQGATDAGEPDPDPGAAAEPGLPDPRPSVRDGSFGTGASPARGGREDRDAGAGAGGLSGPAGSVPWRG